MDFSQNQNIFPAKLWQLVNDGGVDTIKWNDQGDGIIFKKGVIKNKFFYLDDEPHTSSNFRRQLKLYGFKKSQLNKDNLKIRHYFHPKFQRSQPQLLTFLGRCNEKQKKSNQKEDLTERWRKHRNLEAPGDDATDAHVHNGECFSLHYPLVLVSSAAVSQT